MRRIIIIVFLFIGVASCSSPSKHNDIITVDPDSDNLPIRVQDYFEKDYSPFGEEDQHYLNSLLLFFDSLVIERTGISGLDSAYHAYTENIRYVESYMDLMSNLNKDKAKVDSFLLGFNKTCVFPKIFAENYFFTNREMTDTAGFIYNPNSQGSYMMLLAAAANADSIFYGYAESLIIFGGTIPPNLVSGYLYSHPRLDFSNDTIRLVTAIHYISLISETERN